ncbi:MAG: GAF domain-containing protein, partial [Candidatus Rokubacteria bacterium]|nr:GAF domain-containing protein [Candidatus Rokubacteria bacterium]
MGRAGDRDASGGSAGSRAGRRSLHRRAGGRPAGSPGRPAAGARPAAFAAILAELAAQDDLERLCSLIGERVSRLLGTDSAALFLVEGDELVLRAAHGFDDRAPAPRRRTLDVPWGDAPIVRELGYRAVVEAPILLRGEAVGVLAALQKAPRVFSRQDVALLTALAGHTAVALDRTNLVHDLQARLRETEIVADLARALNASLDLSTVLQRVAEGARELAGDVAVVALREPASGVMVDRYLTGSRVAPPGRSTVEPGRGLGGHVMLTGRPARTDDYARDPRFSQDYLDVSLEEGIVARIVVPIRIDDRVEGLLYVDRRSPR